MRTIDLTNLPDSIFNSHSLTFPVGGITVVSGETGSGKTTLLNTLYNSLKELYLPSSESTGVVLKGYAGIPVSPVSVKGESIGEVAGISGELSAMVLKYGISWCSICRTSLEYSSSEEIIETIKKEYNGSLIKPGIPFSFSTKEEFINRVEHFRKSGFLKGVSGKQVFNLESAEEFREPVSPGVVVVDTVEVVEEEYEILEESIMYALELSGGTLAVLSENSRDYFSVTGICRKCGAQPAEVTDNREDVVINGLSKADLFDLPVSELKDFLKKLDYKEAEVVVKKLDFLIDSLGEEYSLSRKVETLTSEETGMILRIGWSSFQVKGGVFIYDDFSLGAEREQLPTLINMLEMVKSRGNTVLVSDNTGILDFIADTTINLTRVGTRFVKEFEILIKETEITDDVKPGDIKGKEGETVLIINREKSFQWMDRCRDENQKNFDYTVIVKAEERKKRGVSTVATYLGLLTEIAGIYSSLPEAAKRGFLKREFLYTTSEGACELCNGKGYGVIAGRRLECELCGGKRFRKIVDEIKFKNLSIKDLMEMQIGDVHSLFINYPKISRITDSCIRGGIGYLNLNRETGDLSRGERILIKLAAECAKEGEGRLLITDEPADGFGESDVRNIEKLLSWFTKRGGSVIAGDYNRRLKNIADREYHL